MVVLSSFSSSSGGNGIPSGSGMVRIESATILKCEVYLGVGGVIDLWLFRIVLWKEVFLVFLLPLNGRSSWKRKCIHSSYHVNLFE